jgi:hypothetical protein
MNTIGSLALAGTELDTAAIETIKIPDTIQLYHQFNQFLIRWTNQESKYVGMRMENHSPLPNEQSILFSEPFKGLLVIRSTLSLEKFLVGLATGRKAGKNFHKMGIFTEMTVLFWHSLALQLWRVDTRTIAPAIMRPSVPADWPDRKADSACTVFIKDHPLELRLWAEVSEREIQTWKRNPFPR